MQNIIGVLFKYTAWSGTCFGCWHIQQDFGRTFVKLPVDLYCFMYEHHFGHSYICYILNRNKLPNSSQCHYSWKHKVTGVATVWYVYSTITISEKITISQCNGLWYYIGWYFGWTMALLKPVKIVMANMLAGNYLQNWYLLFYPASPVHTVLSN